MSDINKEREQFLINYAKAMRSMPLDNIIVKQSPKMAKYTKEQVKDFLTNPQQNAENIRNVVDNLFNVYPQFKSLCEYIPNMALFNYVLIPNFDKVDIDKNKVMKDYIKCARYVQNINIKHEFRKAIQQNFKYDVFYGYEIENTDSYFIMPLKHKYCRIFGCEDGVYLMEYDFSYFKGQNEKLIYGDSLGRVSYPDEFRQKYEIYKKLGKDYQWQQLDNGIATKYDESILEYAIPPFIGLFESLTDIEDYQSLQRAKAETDVWKLLSLTVPLNKNSDNEDDFMLSMETISTFNSIIEEQLPEGVGIITSPMETKEITFNKNGTTERNNVQDAINTMFDKSGFSKLLFSGADNSTALSYSVKVDEQKLFGLYRQYERIVNRKLKKVFNGKFAIKFLDMSKFSEKETQEQLLKSAQASLPVKTMLTASLGLEPLQVQALTSLENDILCIPEKWLPLQSSHTQSDSTNGRPMKEDSEVSESGQQTREIDGNARNKGGA